MFFSFQTDKIMRKSDFFFVMLGQQVHSWMYGGRVLDGQACLSVEFFSFKDTSGWVCSYVPITIMYST